MESRIYGGHLITSEMSYDDGFFNVGLSKPNDDNDSDKFYKWNLL